jgi:tetratricopeptide (TPR) repeat protein
MKRLIIIILMFLFIEPVFSHGEEFQKAQLNRGIRNSDEYSYLLIKKAIENKSDSVMILKKALIYSPDLPAVYFALSKASFSLYPSGIADSIDYLAKGFYAYLRNFWWSFTMTGSLFFSLFLSFTLATAFIVIIRLFSDISLISHDVRETNSKAFLLLILVFLSIISPFLFIAGILVLLGIYMSKIDKIVVYMFLISLIFSPLIFKAASLFINTSASGTIKSIVQVNESKGNNYAISVLRNDNEYNALFSYALALKREGYYDEAIAVYNKLIDINPDPKVYINLANCYVGLNNFEEAVKYYLMAIDLKPLASAYYNLSQISRETFDFEKGNEYFKSAQSLDRTAVSGYRAIHGRSPNRLVVDETINFTELWEYAMGRSKEVSTFGMTLFTAWFVSVISLALLVGFYQLNRLFKDRAFRCRRCNTILCTKCEKQLTWRQMCPACYRSLVKLEESEVKERGARLQSIYALQKKRRDVMKILSFILPGSPQIYAGKILSGFMFMLPFLFFVLIPFTNSIFTPNSLVLSHGFFKWAAILIAIALYTASNFITRQRISKGWL